MLTCGVGYVRCCGIHIPKSTIVSAEYTKQFVFPSWRGVLGEREVDERLGEADRIYENCTAELRDTYGTSELTGESLILVVFHV